MRLKNGREAAEKETMDLKKKVELLEGQNQEMRPIIENMNLQVNDLKNKNDQKTREIDKLKEELKKKEKGFEDKLNIANSKNFIDNFVR